ncbi:MAG: trypsin-like peptidase domain-containing protein, partial [Gemmatimonadales bacterium]
PPVAEQSPTPVAPRRSSGTSATQRIRIEVARQTQSLRRTTLALFAVLVVVSAGFFYSNFRQRQIREAEVAAMRARVDSILSASEVAVQALQGQMQSLAAALENSRTDVRRLRNDLQAAQRSGDAEAIAALQLRLQEASDALSAQQLAAGVDFNAVYEANQRAIAMVWTEFTTGEIVTGTAFAVREDGTMLTNRHVVAGPAGDKTARRVAIKFADSYQVFPGNILRVSDEVDLAVIRVQIRGGVPTVRGLADDTVRPRPGQPAAVIGFPLGSELPMDEEGQGTIARTSLTVGTISKALANVMQLDAWGAEGSSGSPIFDAQGRVISVLYAGQSGGQVVFGVPVSFARDLLGTVN